MEFLQNVLVVITALFAFGYLFQKFVWKPSFLKGKSSKNDCGDSGCGGCH